MGRLKNLRDQPGDFINNCWTVFRRLYARIGHGDNDYISKCFEISKRDLKHFLDTTPDAGYVRFTICSGSMNDPVTNDPLPVHLIIQESATNNNCPELNAADESSYVLLSVNDVSSLHSYDTAMGGEHICPPLC